MSNKQQIRQNFRNAVFKRDQYTCKICGKKGFDRQGGDLHLKYHKNVRDLVALDSHHIRNRTEMPHGGYVPENGITLCDNGCHIKAEEYLKIGSGEQVFSPEYLYDLIDSNHEEAIEASKKL